MNTAKNIWPQGWGKRTTVMGVLNITPDSFSDGGKFYEPNKAFLRAIELIKQGSDIIDIGAQSTRPGALDVGADEEIRRILPVLKLIRENFPNTLISIDTFHSRVADAALCYGANWINDVTAGRKDSLMLRIVASAKCPYVLTHSRGDSQTMDTLTDYNDLLDDIHHGLLRRTELAVNEGILEENIIWDPGIGFAKTHQQNILLIKQLKRICKDKFPVLVGPSRKRFIGHVLGRSNPEERIWGTAAVVCKCVENKVSMVRVHDVPPMIDVIKMAEKLW